MKRIPLILATAAVTILCGEVGASGRTSYRPVSHASTRSTARSYTRPAVHHRPTTHNPVRSVKPWTRQNTSRVTRTVPHTRVTANRPVNGPRRAAPAGFYTHAHRFAHGHWFRHRHACWGSRCWNSHYGCWCRWCPVTCCSYYWCGPYNCYFPVGYCPSGSYDYPEPDGAGPPPDSAPSPDPAPPEEPSPDQ